MSIQNMVVEHIVGSRDGKLLRILGRDSKTGVLRAIEGDAEAMAEAIQALKLARGVEVGVFYGDMGDPYLCPPEKEVAMKK